MKRLFKILLGVFMALMLSGAFCQAAEAHTRVFIRGGVVVGPWWYDPWYEPYYYPPPDYGWLKTDVEPNEAELLVDGKRFGFASDYDGPVNHLRLPVGTHEAEFRLPGYRTFRVGFSIFPGETTEVEYKLIPLGTGPPGEK